MAATRTRRPQTKAPREIGAIRKGGSQRLKIAVVYPNVYHVGMSNLGLQTVYRLFNAMPDVACERVFLPDTSDEQVPLSVESRQTLKHFDLIAFSIAYENDYTNLLLILRRAGLPLSSADRGPPLPLVAAGGVTGFLNPEPIAPFIDLFLIGEAETIVAPLVECALVTGLGNPVQQRRFLDKAAAEVPGAYVPRFHQPVYADDGTLAHVTHRPPAPATVRRAVAANFSADITESVLITPDTTFESTHLLEVSRGCPHGCRFCSAGFVYRPPRFRPLESLSKALTRVTAVTHKAGLVGAAVSDLPDIARLCRHATAEKIRLSFSSLRADALSPELIEALAQSGVKTATIAPDAGSQRMRRVINKGLDQPAILSAAERLVAGGIPNIRLYFMVGLPTETEADIEAIVTLCKKIKHTFLASSRTRGRIGEITVSLSCFVPKPFTPFQWVAMDEQRLLKTKIRTVKNGLKKVANLRVHADVPRWAYIQALLARGDRRVSQILLAAHALQGNWPQALKTAAVNPHFFVLRERAKAERLPWDFIDHGIEKAYLWKEYQKALSGRTTPPCPVDTTTCRRCGVC